MNILIIGAGNMGKAFIESFLINKFLVPDQITVIEKIKTQHDALKSLGITKIHEDFGYFISIQDIIILAIKPQDASTIYPQLKKYIQPNQIILSIMAGITISEMSQQLNSDKIVRCMPNLPCQLGLGVIGYFVHPSIDDEKQKTIKQLIECTGIAISLNSEEEIHSVIAISGSGPAYVFHFMHAMIEQAKQYGYSQQDAENMVAQTFDGAVTLFKNNDFSCEEWISKVASKGGTTEAAIKNFKDNLLSENIQKGMNAALARSVEMSQNK